MRLNDMIGPGDVIVVCGFGQHMLKVTGRVYCRVESPIDDGLHLSILPALVDPVWGN